MKTIALLLVIAVSAPAAEAVYWNALESTWRVVSTDPERLNSFFDIPRRLVDAESAGWVQADVEQSSDVSTWCLPDDPRFCILLDFYGYIAGIQIGVLVNDTKAMQSVYSMARINYYQIKTIFCQEVWTSAAYTQDPEKLSSFAKEYELSEYTLDFGGTYETSDLLTGTEGVWLDTTDGFVKIPRNLEDLDPVWTLQSCVPTMGGHYYYNMRVTTACEDIPPWFLLHENNTLTGIGYQTFGTVSIKNRTWYDVIPPGGVKVAIPQGPQCVYDWAAAYGLISMHVFFTAEPWNITCP